MYTGILILGVLLIYSRAMAQPPAKMVENYKTNEHRLCMTLQMQQANRLHGGETSANRLMFPGEWPLIFALVEDDSYALLLHALLFIAQADPNETYLRYVRFLDLPLQRAVKFGAIDAVRLLLLAGARDEASFGEKSSKLARRLAYNDIAEIIEQYPDNTQELDQLIQEKKFNRLSLAFENSNNQLNKNQDNNQHRK